jgi:amino acid transporter
LLARQEIELAKAEMAEKGRRAGLGLGLVAAAGVSALLALGTLTACVVLALDGAMPAWLAALIVALAWSVVAAVLASVGKQKMEQAGTPVPEQTVESVKEDIKWLKDQTR